MKRKAGDEEGESETMYPAAINELGLSREDVMKMLEPLGRENLMEIIQQACANHPGVLLEVRRFVDADPAHRKLFVRGLGWETSSETLQGVFAQFGELVEATVIRDKITQKSRGFGFVTFKHMDGAVLALKEPSKRIDGRMTVCQFASWAPSGAAPTEEVSLRKIYVGNVPVGLSAEKVLALFSQFGEIAEGPLGFDKATGVSKGFALIIYKTSEGARAALLEPYKSIDGHQVHCKLAVEGHKQQNNHQQQQNHHQNHQQQQQQQQQQNHHHQPQQHLRKPEVHMNMHVPPAPQVPQTHQTPLTPAPSSFHPPNFPPMVTLPPSVYNYNPNPTTAPPPAVYCGQSTTYATAPFYVHPATPAPVPTMTYPTVPLVGPVPSVPSTYGA